MDIFTVSKLTFVLIYSYDFFELLKQTHHLNVFDTVFANLDTILAVRSCGLKEVLGSLGWCTQCKGLLVHMCGH